MDANFVSDNSPLRQTSDHIRPLPMTTRWNRKWQTCALDTAARTFDTHADDTAPFCVAGRLGAELPSLPEDVADGVKAFFDNLTSWLEQVLESGVKGGLIKLDASVQSEAATLVSLVYGAMLAARAYANVALFKEVTEGAVERLVKPRKRTRSA